MNTLIVSICNSTIETSILPDLPTKFKFRGVIYEAYDTLGDCDYILNEEKELIGIALADAKRERKLLSQFFENCQSKISISDGQILLVWGEFETQTITTVQASTWIYRSQKTHSILIGIHEWEKFE